MPATMVAAPPLALLGSRDQEHQAALLRRCRAQFKAVQEYEDQNRRQQQEWLKFRAGQQWKPEEEQRRLAAGRPCLTINTLAQYEHQITNEIRQSMPTLKVLPVGNGADVDTASVLNGIIRHCNQRSHADQVRQWAYDSAVRIGAGYYRMTLDYDDWTSFDQEPRLAGIRNQFAVYLDHAASDPTGRDARWGFVFEEQDKAAFKEEWGIDGRSIDFWGTHGDSWVFREHVRVAEYFWKDEQRYTLAQMSDGSVQLLEQVLLGQLMPQIAELGWPTTRLQDYVARLLTPEPRYAPLLPWIREQSQYAYNVLGELYPQEIAAPLAAMIVDLVRNIRQVRPTVQCTVRWIKTNGHVILEESVWPGAHIPILRVVGEELTLDNHVQRAGIIRDAMDPMRLENYFLTMQAEHVALAPVPPWIAALSQIEGLEAYWDTANKVPLSVLPYNPVSQSGQVLPPPQRNSFEPPIQAIALTLQQVQQYTQQAIGIYQGNVGAPSRERSGIAINAKDRQANTGTAHYPTNLAHTMEYEGELYLEVLPKVMTVGKVQRILGPDGSAQQVYLYNSQGPQPAQKPEQLEPGLAGALDMGTGTYDVAVTVGPSYVTQRQEAAEYMMSMVQALGPNIMGPIAHKIIAKSDVEGAQELADLLKQLPGQILDEGSTDKDGQLALLKQRLQQTIEQTKQLDALAQQMQQALGQLSAENKQLKEAHDLKALEVQDQQRQTDIKAREAAVEMRTQMAEIEIARAELRLAQQQLALQRQEMERQYALAKDAQEATAQGHNAEELPGESEGQSDT
jgi:hypothetical protein